MQLLITKTKTMFLIKKFSWFSWLVWSVIHYYWLMIWKVLKFMNIWTWSFSLLISTTISMVSLFRNINQCRYARTGRKRKRWHIHVIHQYAKTNNKYTKKYYENKESSYLKYWGANNLHGWVMSQKLPVDNFQYKKKHQKLVKDTYLKLMLNIINICMSNTMIYHFYLKKMRIKKCHNFLCHIYDQKKYALHIRTFKKELNHELIF